MTSPLPSMLAGRDSRRDDVFLAELQLGGVLDGDDPLVVGMNAERTLSSVVLPEPVPPETTMLSRASTQASRKSTISGGDGAEADQVVDRQRLLGEFADGERSGRRARAAG